MPDLAQMEARAEHAKRLLADPLFVEARHIVEDTLKDIILTSPISEREKREEALSILKGGEQFFRIFSLIMYDYELHRSEYTNAGQLKARAAKIEEELDGY